MVHPLITTPGMPELLVILVIVVLIFGASKLPQLAKSSGQALRIFKSETKGLLDDDEDGKDEKPAPTEQSARELPPTEKDSTSGTSASETSTERHPG